MTLIAEGLLVFIRIYYFIVFARIILSWVMMGAGGTGGSEMVNSIYRIVYGLTEPLLAPLRSVLPPIKMGMGYLDLSPIVLLILLRIVQQIIINYLYY